MASRYAPMLAALAPAPFSGDEWLFEIKWDGVRAIATVGTTVSLRSRNDMELSGRFPEVMWGPDHSLYVAWEAWNRGLGTLVKKRIESKTLRVPEP